jgi:hypothetical protein
MYADEIRSLVVRRMFAIAVLAALVGVCAPASLAQGNSGAVYTMTNSPTGNSVIVFDRASNGTLTLAGSFPTGGTGLGTDAPKFHRLLAADGPGRLREQLGIGLRRRFAKV